MTRSIALLGSTGSIGRQTLEVARELGLSVAALTANKSVDLIEQQAREFCPRLAVLYDEDAARELRARLSDTNTQVLSGMEGLLAAATADDADTVVTAVMGMIGLQPTLAAIEKKKRIALANKETLVCAGELVVDAAEKYGAEIVPVDSEHSAIFQCLQGCRDRGEIKRLILTCSGGPFYGLSLQELATKTKADALKHGLCAAAALAGRHTGVYQRQLDVFERSKPGQQLRVLEYEADLLPAQACQFNLAQAAHGAAVQHVFAGRGRIQTAYYVHQRRLAAARGAKYRQVFARLYAQRHAF